jgi:hypothetical protein
MHRLFQLLIITALLLSAPGCGFMSHVMYWARGNPVDAKFPGLQGKKVAVVCFDPNTAGSAGDADAVAKAVATKLAMHVKGITVVPHQQVLDWIDAQPGNVSDFQDIGRGVKADMVVGIDLDAFQTHDGKTLLRGRSRVSTKVFDLTKGGDNLVYQTPMADIIYPESGPRPITEDEAKFRGVFLDILSKKIAKDFYVYDRVEDFAMDGAYGGD